VNLRWDAEFTKPFGKMAFATVSTSLFSKGVTMVYLVNASVMHKMYLCWLPAANIGPKRSAWMQMFGWSGLEEEVVCP
jgi:hypothetical protein